MIGAECGATACSRNDDYGMQTRLLHLHAEPLAEDVHDRRNSGKLSDVPNAPCCGEADAYWADGVHVRDGKTYVTITDDRPDEPLGRPHLDVGTEIEIPNKKLKWDKGNPTGHGIVFLSRPVTYSVTFSPGASD